MALSGDKLRAHRQLAGMTQEDLARRMGTTRPQISGWENEHRSPGLSRIQALAGILGVRVDDLLDERGVHVR